MRVDRLSVLPVELWDLLLQQLKRPSVQNLKLIKFPTPIKTSIARNLSKRMTDAGIRAKVKEACAQGADISGWDVSEVTDMRSLFSTAHNFNQDLSRWDVSAVTDMGFMFSNARSFNQDLSSWNVSSVIDMSSMFANAHSFNQDLSGWDVSAVTDMACMFADAHNFSQDLRSWNVSSVIDMTFMFHGAESMFPVHVLSTFS